MSFMISGAIIISSAYTAYSAAQSAKKARKQTAVETAKREKRIEDQKKEEDKAKKQTAMRLQKRRGVAKADASRTRDTVKTGALGVIGGQPASGTKKLTGQ